MAAACLQSLQEYQKDTPAEGKFTKHMNKRCYIVAIVIVRAFLRYNIEQADVFPKWPLNFDI